MPSKKNRRRWIVLVVLVLAGTSASVALALRPQRVTTTTVVRGTAVDAVYATCTVEARERVTVKSRIAGTLAELRVREGDAASEGDLLAQVDSPTLRFQLERAEAENWAASKHAKSGPQLRTLEAQVRATKAKLDLARSEYDRYAKLVNSGAKTRAELDRAENEVRTLEAQLDAQQAQVRATRIDLVGRAKGADATTAEMAARLAETEIHAPLDGTVLTRFVDHGEVVAVNAPIVTIGDVRDLILECHVDEADVGSIDVGHAVAASLYAFSGQVFHGTVTDILPDADRTRKSFLTKVKLRDAPRTMRSGMSAEINIIIAEHDEAVLAPAESIRDGGVWVIEGDRVARRQVQTGIRDMLRVEILDGLAEGDEVVIAGVDDLHEGERVETELRPPDVDEGPQLATASGAGP